MTASGDDRPYDLSTDGTDPVSCLSPPLGVHTVALGPRMVPADWQVSEALLNFFTSAAHEMSLEIDRTVVRRVIAGIQGGTFKLMFDIAEYSRQLAHSASALQMRVDPLQTSPDEALHVVRRGAPIGAIWCSPDGTLNWLLLSEQGDGRVRIVDSSQSEPRWATTHLIKQLIDDSGNDLQWLSLQSSLPCEIVSSKHESKLTPFARYLALLGPERSDIEVILVFALFVGVLALSTPIAVEALVNTVAFGQFVQPVIVLALILFVFMAFSATMRAVQTYVAEIIQRRLFVRIAADLAQRIPRVQPVYWQSHYGPEAINRFFEMVTVQKVTSQLLLDGTALVLQATVGMTVIAFYHPILLGFDAFLLVLMTIIVFLLGRNAVATSTDESRHKYATAAWLEELARHPMLFRSRGGLAFALDRADCFVTKYLSARSEHFRILMRQIVSALFLQAIASTVLLGLGGWLVIRGELTLGQLVAAELIVTLIVGSFAKIGKQLEGFYDVMASMDKLGHLFDMPLERLDGVELPRLSSGATLGIHDLMVAPLATGQSIKHANLLIESGELCSLASEPTGLRSQLLEAIAGYSPVVSGHVEIDGNDIRRLHLDSVRDQVILLRDVEMFAGTVAENLHMGRNEVSEHDVRQALQAAGILEMILDLPKGLATVVQPDGRQFSMDQLVQFALARSLAVRPRLLLIDGLLDRLSDEALRTTIPGILDLGFNTTIIVGTGRCDVASYFRRHLTITSNGTLQETSAGGVAIPSSR